jgi:peptidoglycan/LPS O-acetylase OafA/YrhL
VTPARLEAPSYVPALDGVRGMAIVAVLLFHNFRVPGGWMGVDLFFALSGFLIARILTTTRERPDYFRRFYWRRAWRIFPPYYLLLLVLSVLSDEVRARAWWYATYLSDFVFVNPSLDTAWLHHVWSLAVEEQFYLVVPVLARWLPPPSFRRFVLCLVPLPTLARVAALSMGVAPLFANYNAAARCDGLLMGAVMGSLAGTHGRQAVSVAASAKTLLVCAFVALALAGLGKFSVSSRPSMPMYVLGLPSIALASTALVWLAYAGAPDHRLSRLLARSELRWLGRVSYGLYLYHQPLLVYAAQRWPVHVRVDQLVVGAVALAASLVTAEISFRCFESPLSALKQRWALDERPGAANAPQES